MQAGELAEVLLALRVVFASSWDSGEGLELGKGIQPGSQEVNVSELVGPIGRRGLLNPHLFLPLVSLASVGSAHFRILGPLFV